MIKLISDRSELGSVFLLWGGFAQKKEALIDKKRHRVIKVRGSRGKETQLDLTPLPTHQGRNGGGGGGQKNFMKISLMKFLEIFSSGLNRVISLFLDRAGRFY